MRYPLQAAFSILLLAFAPAACAQKSSDITQFGHDIRVQPEQKVGDLTCFNCSIIVRGQVAGDVTAFLGRIVIDENAQVAGDVTAFAGEVRLNSGAKVAGDATAFAGSVNRQPNASVVGDITSFSGGWWLFLILGAPLIPVGLAVAFVIWLLRRGRTAAVPVRAQVGIRPGP